MSLVIPLFGESLAVTGVALAINYGLNKVGFPAPAPVGSTIRLAARLGDVADVAGGAEAIDRHHP